jgi:hypothetical protein
MCPHCADKGLIRVRYREDRIAVDIAICACVKGRSYRSEIGRAVVAAWYPDGQVGLLEEFDDAGDVPALVASGDVTEAGRQVRKRAKL